MRVSINSPIVSLVVNISEDQLFDLIDKALSYAGKKITVPKVPPFATGGIIPKTEKPILKGVIPPSEPDEIVASTPIITKAINEVLSKKTTPNMYKGFLYLKCEECGKFKAFMPKNPISDYRCDCGHTTKLQDMRALYLNCKCGQKFKYLTNAKDSLISIDCLNCGAPIDLEFHERKQEYVTINSEG